MTNKPMLSVPRELIEQAMLACFEAGFGITHDELRALLDKPAECRCKRYGKDNPHWPCPVHAEPAAQRQGDPMAWLDKESGAIVTAKLKPILCEDGFEIPLYAEQPAPVAVVMPDVDELAQIIRKVNGSHTLGAGSLAEAIIEEVARLNGARP